MTSDPRRVQIAACKVEIARQRAAYVDAVSASHEMEASFHEAEVDRLLDELQRLIRAPFHPDEQ